MMKGFAKDFVWGAACAAYQCEGAWDADGKGSSIWDDFSHDKGKGHVKNDDTGDVACDSYHLFQQDIALMKQIGIRAYRFSVSWPRVIPQGTGAVNEAGLRYYDELIDTLIENGIEPYVTLYHWDLPSALQKTGGWLNRATVDAFADYAALIAKRFDGRVNCYMTINEPQCIVGLGYGNGEHAPGLRLSAAELLTCMYHLVLAHSAAAKVIDAHSSAPVRVGVVPCGRICYPTEDTPAARAAAYKASFRLSEDDWTFTHNCFMDMLMRRKFDDDAPEFFHAFLRAMPQSDADIDRKPDFLGINIYNGSAVDAGGTPVGLRPGFPLTAMKWPVTPQVMHYAPLFLYQRYGLPMMITENGQSCNDRVFLDGKVHDPDRIDFLNSYLLELKKSIDEGAPVHGYLHWSFLDNFEWAFGYEERFGIVYVDYQTQERILKDSAHWYAGVIASSGETL